MTQRTDFVFRALDPERTLTMGELCSEYGISRKTGYKWLKRYREGGFNALESLSRRPQSSPLETSAEMAVEVIALRRERPRWGRKKIHAVLKDKYKDRDDVPSERTIGRILDRAGEPKMRRKKRLRISRTAPQVVVEKPNDLWTVDFKGWWRTGDGARAEPLTVRDEFSRYVLEADLLAGTGAEFVRDAFIRLFQEHGLPAAIQCDNGAPFGSTRARGGMTKLSAWWVSLGIDVVFSRPGHPQDNGGHERMHLDIRYDVEDHAQDDLQAQRRALHLWRHDFNHHRPHESLGQRPPAEVYENSVRTLKHRCRLPVYPPTWATRKVSAPGRIGMNGEIYYVGAAFVGHQVGLEPAGENKVRLWFYEKDLGELDLSVVTFCRHRVTRGWTSPQQRLVAK